MVQTVISCKLCDKLFEVISPSHLKYKHGLTMANYRSMFPEAELASAANRTRRSKAMMGREFTPEWKQHLSEAKRGRPPAFLSDPVKKAAAYAKVSRSSKGRVISQKLRDAVANANRKREWTVEMRERLSSSLKARWAEAGHPSLGRRYKMTEAHRLAISEARAGQIQRGEVAWQIGTYSSPIAGEVFCQSSYEVRFARVLDRIEWQWERCPDSFTWKDDLGKSHRAIPDFKVQHPTGLVVYYDTKGYYPSNQWAKMQQLQAQIRLIVLTEPLLIAYEQLASSGLYLKSRD